jgi:adenylate cyclase
MDGPALAERIRLRYGWAMVGANLAGSLVVFALLTVVLPNPVVHHRNTLKLLGAIAFVVGGLVAFRSAWFWSARVWRERLGWAAAGKPPTERLRDLTLAFPLSQQLINATIWVLAAVLFSALCAPFSLELAGNVAITLVLGGLVTCALGYLVAERLLRPITALALTVGVPPRPQLPGVKARTLLTWTLGTGVVLLGIALTGVGGLHERRFTVERLSIAMLVLSLLGIAVGLTTMIGLARSIADPIRSLRTAASQVERGELDHEVTVDDGSEIGLLQAGFNQMLAGLRERERLRDLFGRQVGEEVVRHALERGVELGGEAREAAALFVDIEGSTSLAEKRGPVDVVNVLNRFFAVVVDVVTSHDGWVNKFEGDAALCVFGAPLADPEAATHALAAARELGPRLTEDVPEINAGIGVSAGTVVAGNIGAPNRFEYTVIGDPVNVAARLCELAKVLPDRVLVSEVALRRAAGAEAKCWEACDEVVLRGREAPTRVAAPASAAVRPSA